MAAVGYHRRRACLLDILLDQPHPYPPPANAPVANTIIKRDMKSNASDALYGSILIIVFILIDCLFIWTQQRVLQAVQPQNRLMRPGRVWLQLIPVFGFFWQFVVVLRIA